MGIMGMSNMYYFSQILIPIAICVVLPIMIVWLLTRAKINRDNKNAEIILKVVESNSQIDTDKLIEALNNPKKTASQTLYNRLLKGCIFTLIGIVVGIIIAVLCCLSSETVVRNLMEELVFLIFVSGVSLAIGIGYMTVFFVTRKNIKSEIEKQS